MSVIMDRKAEMIQPTIEIRRCDQRFHTSTGWLDSHHSFSFGGHYDPSNTHHGLLLVSNDDVVRPGTGFLTHPHQDMEIVTYVLSGELEHKDSVGHQGVIYPGLAQRMSAGTGIWHSEMNPSRERDVHFIQMWVLPDTERITPGYEQADITRDLSRGGLVPIASGRGHDAAVRIRQGRAVLWGGHLKRSEDVLLPDAPHVHLYVVEGAVRLEGVGSLAAGDAVRLTAAGARRLTAEPASEGHVLVWEMHERSR